MSHSSDDAKAGRDNTKIAIKAIAKDRIIFKKITSKKKEGSGKRRRPQGRKSDTHQALEQANADANEADNTADQQEGIGNDDLRNLTDPGNGGGENGTDVSQESSQSVSSMRNYLLS